MTMLSSILFAATVVQSMAVSLRSKATPAASALSPKVDIKAAPVGTCSQKVAYGMIKTTGKDCKALGGFMDNYTDDHLHDHQMTDCYLDWCTDGIYSASAVDTCSQKVGRGILNTTGDVCRAMGGSTNAHPDAMYSDCHLDWCEDGTYSAASVGACEQPLNLIQRGAEQEMSFVGNAVFKAMAKDCQAIGGVVEGTTGDGEMTNCHMDWCLCGGKGTCTVMEDPHIRVFDGGRVSLLEIANRKSENDNGDKWLVKSGQVSIQGRLEDGVVNVKGRFIRAIAVGGAFLKGNTLIVGSLHDKITWNGEPVLEEETSSFVVTAFVNASRGKHSRHVEAPDKEGQGISIAFPMGVSMVFNRLPDHVNVAITMPSQQGGQDGMCGNFNGFTADDSMEFVSLRSQIDVPPEESLFGGYVESQ